MHVPLKIPAVVQASELKLSTTKRSPTGEWIHVPPVECAGSELGRGLKQDSCLCANCNSRSCLEMQFLRKTGTLGVVLRVHVLLSRPLGTFSRHWKFLCRPPVLLWSGQETINMILLLLGFSSDIPSLRRVKRASPAVLPARFAADLRGCVCINRWGSGVPWLLLLLCHVNPSVPSPGMCSGTPAQGAGRDARRNSSLTAPRLLGDERTFIIINATLVLCWSQFLRAARFCCDVEEDVLLERCPAFRCKPDAQRPAVALGLSELCRPCCRSAGGPKLGVGLCCSSLEFSRS